MTNHYEKFLKTQVTFLLFQMMISLSNGKIVIRNLDSGKIELIFN